MSGTLIFRQQLTLLCALAPSQTGAPINQVDFQINPAENDEIDDWSEDQSGRMNIAASGTAVIGMGTIALASVLVLQPDQDIQIQLTNSLGQTQLLTVHGGRTSVFHMDFTGLTIKNLSSSVAATGKYFMAGT